MRIESIYIRGFGKIIEQRFDFPGDKAVLVVEDNESGKSTLAAAITAALCGFPARKSKGELIKLKDVCKPWNCEDYYLEMDIETGGMKLRVERDFNRDSFVVRDLATNRDISAEFEPDIAGCLLRLPREDFQRVAFISGKEVHHFGSSPNIQARLAALVDGSSTDSSASAAISALENVRCSLGGSSIKVDTAVKRLSSIIAEKQRRVSELDASLEAAGDDAVRLDEARARSKELEEQLAELDTEYAAARLVEVRARVRSAESNAGDVESLRNELAKLEPHAAFPAERGTQLTKAAARLAERQAQAESLENQRRSIEDDLQALRVRLEAGEHFASASDGDMLTLSNLENEIAQAQSSVSSKSQEIELEKRALAAEGVNVEGAVEALVRFETLSTADRESLRSFRENQLDLTSQLQKAESKITQARSELQTLDRNRASVQLRGKIVTAAGLASGLVSLMLFILHQLEPTPAVAITIIAIAAIAAGVIQHHRASGLDADRRASLAQEAEDSRTLVTTISGQLAQNDNQAADIACVAGFSSASEAVDAFRESERALGRSEKLNTLRAQLAQLGESLDNATSRASRFLGRFGVRCETDDMPELVTRTRENLSAYLSHRSRLRELERSLHTVTRDLEAKRNEIKEEKSIIESIASDAGIDHTNPIEQIIRDFEESGKLHRRYREINDSLLPAASKHVTNTEVLTRLQAEEAELAALVGESTITERQSSQVDNERITVRRELADTQALVRELDKAVGSCVDNYRREYPALQEELSQLNRELRRITRFGDAVGIAAEVMREVSENSYRRWASALNNRASQILPHLNPDYNTLRFDDTLGFTIRHISDGRIIEKDWIDTQLSTGAKDQVYLAVRLACCTELSELGENIPIILDDPLIAADDSRFERGFRYLVEELPNTNQVIILSCHKSRHERHFTTSWFQDHVDVLDLDRVSDNTLGWT